MLRISFWLLKMIPWVSLFVCSLFCDFFLVTSVKSTNVVLLKWHILLIWARRGLFCSKLEQKQTRKTGRAGSRLTSKASYKAANLVRDQSDTHRKNTHRMAKEEIKRKKTTTVNGSNALPTNVYYKSRRLFNSLLPALVARSRCQARHRLFWLLLIGQALPLRSASFLFLYRYWALSVAVVIKLSIHLFIYPTARRALFVFYYIG